MPTGPGQPTPPRPDTASRVGVPPKVAAVAVVVAAVAVGAFWFYSARSAALPAATSPAGARPSVLDALRRPLPAAGRVLHVAPDARSGGDGSWRLPFATVDDALSKARPGDTVFAGAGVYRSPITTVRSGRPGAPIRVISRGASLVGDGDGRLVQILHDYVSLEGFAISRADILVWVQGAIGVRILGNTLREAGSECIRLKYMASGNEVAGNHITGCGRRDFALERGRKNGEGIYIGTAPEQLDRNPTSVPDLSDGNWIHDNVISVPAECVDVKEAAAGNVVEHNTCTGGRDPDGAGLSSRGRLTTFVRNVSRGHAGAGIRLGGDTPTDGILSHVTDNVLADNDGYGLKVRIQPQGVMCGNDLSGNHAGPSHGDSKASLPCHSPLF